MGATGRNGAAAQQQQQQQQKGGQCKGEAAAAAEAQEKGQRRTCLQNQLHKTKFCMYHMRGACQYGSECAFAHSCAELQVTPDLRKTRLCTDFMEGLGCNNPKCPFAHGEEELRSTDMFFKKTLCIWNEKGKCRNGDQCRFAHGSADMRSNHAPVAVLDQHSAAFSSGGGGRNGGGRGSRKAAGTKRTPATAATTTPTTKNEPVVSAEPMKIQPTRSLLDDPESALKMQHFLPKGAEVPQMVTGEALGDPQYQDMMKSEIERLRHVLSALTMKCSSIQQNMYGQSYTGVAGSEAAEVPSEFLVNPAWPAGSLGYGLGLDEWQHYEQHGMGC